MPEEDTVQMVGVHDVQEVEDHLGVDAHHHE
jgi:hypothetical protein